MTPAEKISVAEKIEVMQAYLDGKPIEYSIKGAPDTWNVVDNPTWDWPAFTYRVAQPKQLGPEDFPPGTVVRKKDWAAYQWKLVVAVSNYYITIINDTSTFGLICKRFEELTPDWERSIDGGQTWLPC